jgi:hypothetical protein
MVTTVMPNVPVPKPRPGRRYDNLFVSGMLALLLGTVLFGFARTYFLAGMLRAPLANNLLHVHGAAFTCWMLLLIVQTSLVRAHRVDIHRKLGLAGFALACVMVVLGLLAAADALSRNVAPIPHLNAKTFYTIRLGDMLIFSTLIFFAYRMRRNPVAHKRLILIATIAIMDAAIDRWPLAFVHHNHVSELFNYSFLLFIVLYDVWSTGKVQRVTVWASLFVIVMQQLRIPVGHTSTWQAFATWVQSLHV